MNRARAFAVVGLGLTVAGVIGTAIIRYVAPAPFITGAFGFDGWVMLGFLIEATFWAAIGTLLVLRRPGNAVGWLMVPVGVGYSLSMVATAAMFAFVAEGTSSSDRLAQYAGWATVLLQLVGLFLVAIGFIFPTGRPQSRAWSRFLVVFAILGAGFVAISLTQPGPLQLVPDIQNPFGIGPDLRGERPLAPILLPFLVVIIGGLGLSMVTRYRAAPFVERQQQKWFVLALAVSAIGLAFVTAGSILFDDRPGPIGLLIHVIGGVFVPVAIGVAILRHHLYDIDRIVSRTIGYAIVTAALAGIFAAAALILGAVLGAQGAGETFQVAGATLLVFALFGRVRRRVQSAVDRRFDRANYDAERTAAAFAARLGSQTDMTTVTSDLAATTVTSVAPSSLSIWLRGTSR